MVREDLDELVQSIKVYGVLEPIVVAETPAGYQIIAGERRWRAAKEAGLTEIPAVVKRTTPRGMLEMALIENIQRVDLNALERAQAFRQLMRDFKFTVTQIAERTGKSSPYVSNSIKLLRLPDAIKDGLLGGMVSEGHARALASLDNEKSMIECYKVILKESSSVRRAEALVRMYKERDEQKDTGRGRPMQINDQQVSAWQKGLQAHFKSKMLLKLSRSARQTRVSFTLVGPPEQTQSDLEKIMEIASPEGK